MRIVKIDIGKEIEKFRQIKKVTPEMQLIFDLMDRAHDNELLKRYLNSKREKNVSE